MFIGDGDWHHDRRSNDGFGVGYTRGGDTHAQMIEKDWVKAEAAKLFKTTTQANGRNVMELGIATDPEKIKPAIASIETNE